MGRPSITSGLRVLFHAITLSVAVTAACLLVPGSADAQVETGAIEKPIPDEPVAATKPANDDSNKKPFKDSSKSDEPETPAETDKPAGIAASLETRSEARTFTLAVPAPRGQILDRVGRPLAQSKVGYYAAINFPQLKDASDTEILRYAGERIVHTNQMFGTNWDLPAKTVLEHYQNRRWLPLTYSEVLSESEVEEIRTNGMKGLILQPVYMRHYPNGAFLSHVLGYVGKRPPRSTGPIGRDEALWGEGEGAEGLEEQFDRYLKGEPGEVNMLFEADGTKLREEVVRRPKPGQSLVTTIDAEMQRLTERLLAENTKSGAFVVMDVRTGDIVAMASWPQFDPNDFIPKISTEKFAALQNDPEQPLFPRAFRGNYPPASTFKVVVALAALENKTISESSLFSCPTQWHIGNVIMHNWNKDPEGNMNVVGALARSCNTWFYQVGIRTGTDGVTSMARRLGLGEKTGIPLKAEAEGFIPTDRWWREKHGYFMSDGDLANICIGQGLAEASPLQIARMMAAIGNRRYTVTPRLVKQVQDFNHNIVANFPVEERNELNIDPYYLDVVRKGMNEVVNSGRGTGTQASNDKIVICGKTGTGQWKPALEQNLAWFAGFAPADYPVYSFAVIYEGVPGEKVGGGSKCAPIIGSFFEEYLKDEENLMAMNAASDAIKIEVSEYEPVRARPAEPESIFRNEEVEQQNEKPPAQSKPEENKGALSRWFSKFKRR